MTYFNVLEGSTEGGAGSQPWPISTFHAGFLRGCCRQRPAPPTQDTGGSFLLFLPELRFKSPEETLTPASKMNFTRVLFI